MEFRKYPSITNSYQQEFLENVHTYHGTGKWIVQEKVHGANFAIYANAEKIQAASRNGFIDPDDNFYSYSVPLSKYSHSVKLMASNLGEIIIYGELCGGNYNGERQGKMVQRGVQYCPENEFLIFDIVINDHFMVFDEVVNLACEYNLKLCPVLHHGTLGECIDYPNEFITKVPDIFGLSPIDGNICEGVVIRPNNNCWWGDHRIILKNKNSKFSEKDERPIKLTNEFPIELMSALEEILPYLNNNRIDSVASKLGELTIADFQKLIGLTIQDALQDAGDIKFNKLEPVYKKIVSRELTKRIIPMVREYFGIK